MKTFAMANPKKLFCSLLLLIAPLLLTNTACFSLWGEPEIPEALK